MKDGLSTYNCITVLDIGYYSFLDRLGKRQFRSKLTAWSDFNGAAAAKKDVHHYNLKSRGHK